MCLCGFTEATLLLSAISSQKLFSAMLFFKVILWQPLQCFVCVLSCIWQSTVSNWETSAKPIVSLLTIIGTFSDSCKMISPLISENTKSSGDVTWVIAIVLRLSLSLLPDLVLCHSSLWTGNPPNTGTQDLGHNKCGGKIIFRDQQAEKILYSRWTSLLKIALVCPLAFRIVVTVETISVWKL